MGLGGDLLRQAAASSGSLSRAIIGRHIFTDASFVMKPSIVSLVATVVVAAFAAAIVTEISHRLLPGNYLGLLVLTFLACFVTALAAVSVSGRKGARKEPVRARQRRPRARRAPAGDRESGVVKWFDPTKGFGFIIRDAGGDIFVHRRSIRDDGTGDRELREGARVTFVAVERSRGWRAEEVSTQDE